MTALPQRLEPATLEAGGRTVPIYRCGPPEGVPVLALHGGYTNPVMDFGPLLGKLDPRLSIVAPVLSGHAGRAVEPGEAVGPATVARDAADMIAALGWQRPIVLGFSLGARAAMIGVTQGLEVSALVLIATRFVAFRAPEYVGIERSAIESLPEWQAPERAPQLAAMRKGIVAVDVPFDPFVEAIRDVPVLVVKGERDRIVPDAEMEALAAAAPSVELASIEGRGHRPQDKAADAVAERVNRFLDTLL